MVVAPTVVCTVVPKQPQSMARPRAHAWASAMRKIAISTHEMIATGRTSAPTRR